LKAIDLFLDVFADFESDNELLAETIPVEKIRFSSLQEHVSASLGGLMLVLEVVIKYADKDRQGGSLVKSHLDQQAEAELNGDVEGIEIALEINFLAINEFVLDAGKRLILVEQLFEKDLMLLQGRNFSLGDRQFE
jgi:hypothetical protein